MSVGEVCFAFLCWCRGQKVAPASSNHLLSAVFLCPSSSNRYDEAIKMRMALESGGYRNRRRKGIRLLSWKSGAFLGARSVPWLSAHTSDACAARSLLLCSILQSLRRQPVSVVAMRWHSCWSDSRIYQMKEESMRTLMSAQTNSGAFLWATSDKLCPLLSLHSWRPLSHWSYNSYHQCSLHDGLPSSVPTCFSVDWGEEKKQMAFTSTSSAVVFFISIQHIIANVSICRFQLVYWKKKNAFDLSYFRHKVLMRSDFKISVSQKSN